MDMRNRTRFPRSPRLLVALAIVLTLILAACGGDDDDEGVVAGDDGADNTADGAVTGGDPDREEPADAADPFGTVEWMLASATVDGETLALLESHPVTLLVDDAGAVGGTAACNSYFGTLIEGDTLFEGFGVTEMACDPPETLDLESAFLTALGRTTTAERDGGQLVLAGDGVELRFDEITPPADAELIGTDWTLDTVISGDAASSILADTNPRLELTETELVAFDGCNTLAGGYEIDGDTIRTGALRSTTRGCSEDVTRQAMQVSAVLTGGPTFEIEGNHLTLSGPDGLELRFTAG